MTRKDCIYFEEKEEETGLNHCIRTRSLNNDGKLCDICRLWDSYIPKNSSLEQIEKAKNGKICHMKNNLIITNIGRIKI